jgi:hypothetical protein
MLAGAKNALSNDIGWRRQENGGREPAGFATLFASVVRLFCRSVFGGKAQNRKGAIRQYELGKLAWRKALAGHRRGRVSKSDKQQGKRAEYAHPRLLDPVKTLDHFPLCVIGHGQKIVGFATALNAARWPCRYKAIITCKLATVMPCRVQARLQAGDDLSTLPVLD